jgi:hypothetical protein
MSSVDWTSSGRAVHSVATAGRGAFIHFGCVGACFTLIFCCFPVVISQGNKAGLVGCGFYNNNCGGLDMGAAWEAVYISIAILAVVVFPFMIFLYEADDEGLSAMKAGSGKIGQMCNAAQCTKAILSALCYELILLVIAIPILMITWTYLGVSWIPVSATTIDARSGNAFYPSTSSNCDVLSLSVSVLLLPPNSSAVPEHHNRVWHRKMLVRRGNTEDGGVCLFGLSVVRLEVVLTSLSFHSQRSSCTLAP